MHVEAILCYKKALTLEPNNESYVTNLRYSQTMLAEIAQQGVASGGAGAGAAPAAGPLGGLENLMRNPNLVNMASQMLRDPAMHQMYYKQTLSNNIKNFDLITCGYLIGFRI